MKRILICGGAGFIGSEFTIEAVNCGHPVTVLDALTYAGHIENLEEISGTPAYRFVHGNIRDVPLVKSLMDSFRPDWIVNFAAESHVDRSINGAAPFIETNIVGSYCLLQSALEYWRGLSASERGAFRFLQISTDEVFGSLDDQGSFHECSPYAPNSPYSASKAAGDHLTRAWHHTYGLPVLVSHCSNNYGPRQYPEKLIPLMIQNALTGKKLPVYGKGENVRDWIHVEDHCNGLFLALEKGMPGGVYCFGGHAERSNLDLVKTLCAILDELQPRNDGKKHESAIEFVKDRPGHDWRYAIDDSKAMRELGFQRKYELMEGLKKTVKWYVDHPDWVRKVLSKGKT